MSRGNLDDGRIAYAMQQTRVLYVPDRRIDTFGETRFRFAMVSELMDSVDCCRIRTGVVEANRPRILRPADLRTIETEGFRQDVARIFEWMAKHGAKLQPLLNYGFQFIRSSVEEELVHDKVREVEDRVVREALHSGDPLKAVIAGVDDDWEVSLLRFMIEMIQKSHEINIFDFKRRGLL